MQPGSLFSAYVDTSMFEAMIPRLDEPAAKIVPVVQSEAYERQNSGQIHIVPAQAPKSDEAAPAQTAPNSLPLDRPIQIGILPGNSTPARVPSNHVDIHPALAAPGRSIAETAQASAIAKQNAGSNILIAGNKELQAQAAPEVEENVLDQMQTYVNGNLSTPSDNRFSYVDCNGGSGGGGTRANLWNSYDSPTSARADGVQDMVVDDGAGYTIAVGFQARSATIRKYDLGSGACIGAGINVPPDFGAGANRARATGAVLNSAGTRMYVSFNHNSSIDGLDKKAEVRCFDPATMTPCPGSAPFVILAGGGELRFEDVGLSREVGDEEVHITGHRNDGTPAHDVILDIKLDSDAAMTFIHDMDRNPSAGFDSRGLSTDGDATGDYYIGSKVYAAAGIGRPNRSGFTKPGVSKFSLTYTLGTPIEDPNNGQFVTRVGACAAGTCLYTGGTIEDGVFNPGKTNTLFGQRSLATGATVAYGVGFAWTIAGVPVDAGINGGAVDAASQFGFGYIETVAGGVASGFTNSFVAQLDIATITITSGNTTGDDGVPATLKNTVARGGDVLDAASATSGVVMGGETTVAPADMVPAPGGCLPAGIGGIPSDGWVSEWDNPV
jgi:hypothetical protein